MAHAVTAATASRGLARTPRAVAREPPRSRARAPPPRAAASPAVARATTSSASPGVREAKRALFEACEGTFRGSAASASERAAVEEAQVALEGFTYASNLDPGLDLDALAGKWRLRWTNANDVLSVLRLARDSFGALQVGDIFQTFDARGSLTNEIRLGLAFLTQSAARDTEGGLALKVGARYERVDAGASKGATTKNDDAKKKQSPSRRTLALVFEEAKVTELRISDELELVFAPALLPRGAVNHRLLLALREAEARFDLSSAVAIGATPSSSVTKKKTGAPVGASHVTYLDEDTLIGRANGAGGTFIFDRVA
jgi:hypothetical protein